MYIKPCNGKVNDCANAVWIKSGGKVDIYKLSFKELKALRKTGKLPAPNVGKKKRVRLSDQVDDKPKRKKRRVRL